MWFTQPRQSYAPLQDADSLQDADGIASDELGGLKESTADERGERHATVTSTGSLSRITIVVSILCALFNLTVVVYVARSNPHSVPGDQNSGRLPRPNQYMGLERVNRKALNATPPDPIANYPSVLTQISKQNPAYVYPTDTRRYWIPGAGTVSPDDRHFFVDEHVNTVAQFRVRDFGMERCQIVLNIPTYSAKDGPPTPPFTLRPQNISLDVWQLDADDAYFADVRKLSWNTRPKRVGSTSIATLRVIAGSSVRSEVFACRADSVQTFEFACSDATPQCYVDFWQDNISSEPAAFLQQYSSV